MVVSGWMALAAIPLVAIAGWFLRRLRGKPVLQRMRPHMIAGYLALGAPLLHAWFTGGAMSGANALGLELATAALLGLILQALIGANLQDPGTYRKPLRRAHVVIFWSVLAFALAHIYFSAPYFQNG